MRFALGFLTAIALTIIAALTVIWTGAFNVAASEPHAGVVRWAFDTTLHNSVESRADDSVISPQSIQKADLRAGFREFQEYCVHCHGAPGVKPHEWTTGMTPNPPELSRAAREWTPDQIFWIVKHGIKMTGMPPFGDTENDETIRNIAAFVHRMQGMRPEQYQRLQQAWGSAGAHSHGGGTSLGHGHGSEEAPAATS